MNENDAPEARARLGPYPFYVVGVLMLMYVLSFTDRAILGLMVDPIRRDLSLTDTHISVLSGFAFALFYSIMGLPFARWADTGNRKLLIVFGAVFWSFATVTCGFATGFTGLLIARFCVGIGEATLSPAAYSMIADYFPRRRLGFAMSIYASGVTLGAGLAIAAGGALVAWAEDSGIGLPGQEPLAGWRLALMVLGVAGLAIPLLLWATVKEPARRLTAGDKSSAPNLAEVFRYIRSHGRMFFAVYVGYTFAVIMSLAQIIWAPAFFVRVHEMNVREFALLYGLMMGVGGTIGLICGGILSDAITRRGRPEAPMIVILGSTVLQLPFLLGAFLVRDTTTALWLFAGGLFTLSLIGGLQGATLQLISPERMRGRISSIYIILTSITGGGLVPVAIALLSEHVFSGPWALGEALSAAAAVTLPIAAIILLLSLRTMADTVRKLRVT